MELGNLEWEGKGMELGRGNGMVEWEEVGRKGMGCVWVGMGWVWFCCSLKKFFLLYMGRVFQNLQSTIFQFSFLKLTRSKKERRSKKPLKKFHIYASNRYPIMFIIG